MVESVEALRFHLLPERAVEAGGGGVDGGGADVDEPAHARGGCRPRHALRAGDVDPMARSGVRLREGGGAVVDGLHPLHESRDRAVIVQVADHDLAAIPLARGAAVAGQAKERPDAAAGQQARNQRLTQEPVGARHGVGRCVWRHRPILLRNGLRKIPSGSSSRRASSNSRSRG